MGTREGGSEERRRYISTVRVDGETTGVGEVSSDDGHGGPVVPLLHPQRVIVSGKRGLLEETEWFLNRS